MNKIDKKCKFCGREFLSIRKSRIYCSHNCVSKQWKLVNPEKIKESQQKYLKNNPEKIKETVRKYLRKNRKMLSKKAHEWQKNNPDKYKIIRDRWWKKNYYTKLRFDKKFMRKNSIRGITYYHFGPAEICLICDTTKNVQHHHTTIPYEFDKFVDLCLTCHSKLRRGEINVR